MRITVVHQGALGDAVLLVPLVKSLRRRFGEHVRVTLVTRANLGQMLTMLGLVEGWASAEDREHTLWFAEPGAAELANSAPVWAECDVLFSGVSNGADAWARNARALIENRKLKIEKVGFFNPRPPEGYQQHVTRWHREQLGELGLEEAAGPLLRNNPDGAVVIHPGSGGEAKCWPREKFLELGRALKRNGIVPTFILGEAEQERWGNKLIEGLKEEFPWYLHLGLYELAERMGRARMYVGNDSGVTHLAGMLGVPVVALFGPSDERVWGPVGASVKILRAGAPREKDLGALEVEVVLGEVMAELRKLGGG